MVHAVMLLCLAFQATASSLDVTPVEKVVIMLRDLQSQVADEGHAEASTYDEYACFCKSKTDEKSTSIKEGEASVGTLRADIDGLQSRRTQLGQQIDTCNANILLFNEELANATSMRKTERKAYEAAFADMEKACTAIRSAITTLKSSKLSDASFASVKASVGKTLIMADAIGVDSEAMTKAAKVFLEQPVSDYDFHSNDIIATLEGLLKTFTEKTTELQSEEVSAQSAFDSAAQAKKDQISTEQTTLELKQKALDVTVSDIAMKGQELTDNNANLNDDRVYLSDLTSQCEDKAKMWDQRQAVRADELAAITQALSVIEGAVSNKATLTGEGARSGVITSALETTETKDVSFIQVREVKKKDVRVEKVMALLKTMGDKLKSHILSTLATKVSEDPFAKVKTLIQELIERLLQEQSDEASQKGWCDTEIGKATKDRDYRVRDLDELEGNLMELYANKIQLEGTVEKLDDEIASLNDDLLNATQMRQQEKAENTETISNAQGGEVAVQQAIDILSHFYGEAKQAVAPEASNTTDLHEGETSPVAGEIPDAGFDSAYTGSQSASTGIIGMLEVIKGDFQRTARDTTMDEEKSVRKFVEFERATKMSIASKSESLANTKKELSDTNDKISSDLSDYSAKQGLLDGAVDALEKLHPVCQVEGGSTAEDRSERRDAEIEALKQALCILDDGAGDYCGVSFMQKRAIRHA